MPNPSKFLRDAIKMQINNQVITETTTLFVATSALPTGQNISNIDFLQPGMPGPTADFNNAAVVQASATFWIETVQGQAMPQLQYAQSVILNFGGVNWPHVSVATLTLQPK